MNFPATEMMQARKSVRTFDGRPIRPEDRAALEGFLSEMQNPFAVPVEFRLLDAKAHGLASPVILGADTYLAAKVTNPAVGSTFGEWAVFALNRGGVAKPGWNDTYLENLKIQKQISKDLETLMYQLV